MEIEGVAEVVHVVINLRLFIKGEIGGLENYVRNVVGGVAEALHRRGDLVTVLARRSEVDNLREIAPQARFAVIPHSRADACAAAEIEIGGYDVLFCPLLVLEPVESPVPSAVMVPDLQHVAHPEFFESDILEWRRQLYLPTIEKADVLFTLSDDAKAMIGENFEVALEKIEIVHLDVDPEFRRSPTDSARRAFAELELPDDYLYYPANYWPHKNHETLLRAMRELADRYRSLHLVLTGAGREGEARVRAEAGSLGLGDRVRILGYQEQAVLPEIYRHARMLVFPSLFEGFGIPILEAFHCGTPVVASDRGSCPEIAGDAALLVDATDASAIAAGVARLLEDAALRRDLAARGRARTERFSWGEAVDRTLASLDRIALRRPAGAVVVEDRPVVSIVTPTFNMAKYLEETIESVLSQDYPHIDYIVMDGGSTDGTREILEKYAGRLRYWCEPDGGQGDAINKGFRESRGRVFSFLNADDTYLPGAVGVGVSALVADPAAAVVYGEGWHVFENGELMERYPTLPFSPDWLMRNCFICQPTTFMWADIFESAGMMRTDVIALDYDLWIRIAQQGHRFVKVDDDLATSRMYRDNKTLRQRGAVYRDIIGIVKRRYGYVSYDWLFGYACYLVDGKDQVFEPTSSSRFKALVALALGAVYNPTRLPDYVREWALRVGLGPGYSGRWEDGWISRRYAGEHAVADSCKTVRIAGRHLGPQPMLGITVRLEGKNLGRRQVSESGPFVLELDCPADLRGGSRLLEIHCDATFQPNRNGDERHLGCIVDSIEFVAG